MYVSRHAFAHRRQWSTQSAVREQQCCLCLQSEKKMCRLPWLGGERYILRTSNIGPARMTSPERAALNGILDKIFSELGGDRPSACLLALVMIPLYTRTSRTPACFFHEETLSSQPCVNRRYRIRIIRLVSKYARCFQVQVG